MSDATDAITHEYLDAIADQLTRIADALERIARADEPTITSDAVCMVPTTEGRVAL